MGLQLFHRVWILFFDVCNRESGRLENTVDIITSSNEFRYQVESLPPPPPPPYSPVCYRFAFVLYSLTGPEGYLRGRFGGIRSGYEIEGILKRTLGGIYGKTLSITTLQIQELVSDNWRRVNHNICTPSTFACAEKVPF